jgi:hypothetical protein
MAVFWAVAPCSLVKFTDVSEVLAASIIRAIVLMMDQTTRRNNPKDSHFCFDVCRINNGAHSGIR